MVFLEFQVILKGESPMRAACVEMMNAFIAGAVDTIPTRTPYYRVMPVEATVRHTSEQREITINVTVPDSREVLPIDVVSEMLRGEQDIAVAHCYCRLTKKLLGEDCGHLLETCFYFNELVIWRPGMPAVLTMMKRCTYFGSAKSRAWSIM